MTTTPDFEPVDLDQCDNTSEAHYRQRDLMKEIARDLSMQGEGELCRIFRGYALYSHQMGNAWRWKELGDERQFFTWLRVATETFEAMPDISKWA